MALPIVPWAGIGAPSLTGYLGNPYLGHFETSLIVALMRGVGARTVIEFGCQAGRTTHVLLKSVPTIERYIGIDLPDGTPPTLKSQRSEVHPDPGYFARRDTRFELLLPKGGSQTLTAEDLPPADAVFIDGDHGEQTVRHDSELARAVVRQGGVIIWHDYENWSVEVTPVLDKLFAEGWPLVSIQSTWLVFMHA